MFEKHPLRELRYHLGDLEIQEVADLLGVSHHLYAKVENQTYPSTPWKLIECLNQHLGWSLDDARAACASTLDATALRQHLQRLPESLSTKLQRRLKAIIKGRTAA